MCVLSAWLSHPLGGVCNVVQMYRNIGLRTLCMYVRIMYVCTYNVCMYVCRYLCTYVCRCLYRTLQNWRCCIHRGLMMGCGVCVSVTLIHLSSLTCLADHQAIPHSQSSPLCQQRLIGSAFQVARSTSAMAMASPQSRVVMRRKPLPSQGHFSPELGSQGVAFGMQSSTELPRSLKQLPSQDSLISTGAPETGCLHCWSLWCMCNQEYHHTHAVCV